MSPRRTLAGTLTKLLAIRASGQFASAASVERRAAEAGTAASPPDDSREAVAPFAGCVILPVIYGFRWSQPFEHRWPTHSDISDIGPQGLLAMLDDQIAELPDRSMTA